MLAFRSVTSRLIAWILTCAVLIYVAVLAVDTRLSGRLVDGLATTRAKAVAGSVGASLETLVREVESSAGGLATAIAYLSPSDDDIHGLLEKFVADHPAVFGSALALEAPGADGEPFARYVYRDGPSIVRKDLAGGSFDFRQQPWYRIPAQTRESAWSEPYFDRSGGEVEMVTFSVPLFRGESGARRLAGVLTADVALDSMRARIAAMERRSDERSDVFVLSREGLFVSRPKRKSDEQMLAETALEAARGVGDPTLIQTVQLMIAGGSGTADFADPDGEGVRRIYYAPVPATGWSVGVAFDKKALLEEVRLVRTIEVAVAGGGLLLLAVLIVWLARRITRPLRRLAGTTQRIARGELDFHIPDHGSADEVGSLARAFNVMRDELARYIENLKETTAAKQRLESELAIARQIQMSMLPVIDHVGDESRPYDIAATLVPARAVGGDLFDVFSLADGRLFFAIGDVSDKGVPAALFMARTVALAKLIAARDASPAVVLSELNEKLCENNDACMFVTYLCAVLDPESGRLSFASAGHEPPVLLEGEPGSARLIEPTSGPALGLRRNAAYGDSHLHLSPGDTLLLYTDGVTEAMNAEKALYGVERLTKTVDREGLDSARAVAARLLESVSRFVGDANQSDDITVLALRYRPENAQRVSQTRSSLRLQCTKDMVKRANAWLLPALEDMGVAASVIGDLELATEEVLANVIEHAYPEGSAGEVVLSLSREGDAVLLECRDQGPPFNPLELADPELNKPLAERAVGGLGVYLVKRLAHRVDYARHGDANVLTVTMSLDGASRGNC